MRNEKIFKVKTIWPGNVSGLALVSRERLSFHGYTDPKKGIFKGPTKELAGAYFGQAILVFISGKGASAGPRLLDLACRYGHAPAGIINVEIEPIMVQGCVFQNIPLVQVEDYNIFEYAKNRDNISINTDKGIVIIN